MNDPQDDPRIGIQDLYQRAKAQTYEFYSQMVFLMKGAVLTVAATALIGILQSMEDRNSDFQERLLFFLASLPVVLVTLVTYRRGILLASPSISFIDYLAPLCMGAAEVAAFVVVTPGGIREGVDFRSIWFLVVSLHSFFAVWLVATRLRLTHEEEFVPEFKSVLNEYKVWLRGDIVGATGSGIVCLLIFLFGADIGLSNTLALPSVAIEALRLSPFVIGVPSGYSVASGIFGLTLMMISWKAMHEQGVVWVRVKTLAKRTVS